MVRFVQHLPPQKEGATAQGEALGPATTVWWDTPPPCASGMETPLWAHSTSDGNVLVVSHRPLTPLPLPPTRRWSWKMLAEADMMDGFVVWGGNQARNVWLLHPRWMVSFPPCDQQAVKWVDGVENRSLWLRARLHHAHKWTSSWRLDHFVQWEWPGQPMPGPFEPVLLVCRP